MSGSEYLDDYSKKSRRSDTDSNNESDSENDNNSNSDSTLIKIMKVKLIQKKIRNLLKN